MQQRNEFFHVVERQLQRASRESFAQLMAHGRYWSLRHLCSSSAHQCRCVCVVGGFGPALSCWGNGCHCLIFAKVVDFTCRPLCVIIRSGQGRHYYASRAEREANHAWETGCLVLDDDEKLLITDIKHDKKSASCRHTSSSRFPPTPMGLRCRCAARLAACIRIITSTTRQCLNVFDGPSARTPHLTQNKATQCLLSSLGDYLNVSIDCSSEQSCWARPNCAYLPFHARHQKEIVVSELVQGHWQVSLQQGRMTINTVAGEREASVL